MSEDTRKEFLKLVERYLNGVATEEERRVVEGYYELFDAAPDIAAQLTDDKLEKLHRRIKTNLEHTRKIDRRVITKRLYFSVAAALVVFMGIAWLANSFITKNREAQIFATKIEKADDAINRYLTLPDGTTVILHSGSKLEIAPGFNENSRSVVLIGEAYFDVAIRPEQPFTIHTGKLKTTVLGTAFNIKAWPDQKDITVSVTRGKVKVEDDNKVLAILTPDKQITYYTESFLTDEKVVESDETLSWIQKDMTFDEMPLGELADHIGKRYGVEIQFISEELALCPITGRFNGTETLEEVMKTLALTSNARFSLRENIVFIEGEKCI